MQHQSFFPCLGMNLTEEDRAAFHVAGLPLPQYFHGPRATTADDYAAADRRDSDLMGRLTRNSSLWDKAVQGLTPAEALILGIPSGFTDGPLTTQPTGDRL